jgi:hypothetical protein
MKLGTMKEIKEELLEGDSRYQTLQQQAKNINGNLVEIIQEDIDCEGIVTKREEEDAEKQSEPYLNQRQRGS